jgi:hypothetical protein
MTLPLETTPAALTPKIGEFCRSIVPDGQAIFVPVQPCEGAERASCFENVARYAAQFGGSSMLGWRIWERPGIHLHAEFYAVWKAPNGELLDVSSTPEHQTLFLPDPKLAWKGKQIPSRFLPLVHWREIQDYLTAYAKSMLQPGSNSMELKRAIKALEKRLERSK